MGEINNEPSLTSGELVRDYFESEAFTNYIEIPTSGYHSIYKVKRNGRFYILKGLKPQHRNNPSYRMMLHKEYEICSNLSHHNIVHTYGKTDDPIVGPCIILEYISGMTLQEKIDNHLKIFHAFLLVNQLLDALEYIQHYGIIHRDLKPDNIIITNNAHNIKIIDFDLADQDSFDTLKTIVGDNEYMAPEYQNKGAFIDCRADIYSLGKIIKKLTPLYPFVVLKCLRTDPKKRFCGARSIKYSLKMTRFFIVFSTILLLIVFMVLNLLHWKSINFYSSNC